MGFSLRCVKLYHKKNIDASLIFIHKIYKNSMDAWKFLPLFHKKALQKGKTILSPGMVSCRIHHLSVHFLIQFLNDLFKISVFKRHLQADLL